MAADLARAAQALVKAEQLVVLTGAGMSKESGIPTFREARQGLWAEYDPVEMATYEGFLRNPPLVWSWYEHRFGMVESAEPNSGHLAIAEMEKRLPSVTVVTQNVDGLHQAAGSTHVLELHGSIRRYRCLGGRHTGFTPASFAGQAEKPPRCPYCQQMLRPEVVWFGEYLPQDVLAEAYSLSQSCDVMLVIGTSGVVQPAASLPFVAKAVGATIIDVNPDADEIAQMADVFLPGPAGDILPRLVAAMH
jgi:NAD-dependent deacetylase